MGVKLISTLLACKCGHQWWSKSPEPKRCPKCGVGRQTKLQKAVSEALAIERLWWHKNWHRDTGIPCDGTMEVCKRARS